MADLVLNTKESMYESIVVKIDDIKHKMDKKITPGIARKIQDWAVEAIKANDEQITYDMIIFLFPTITKEMLLKLDIREIASISTLIHDRIMNPQKGLKKKT